MRVLDVLRLLLGVAVKLVLLEFRYALRDSIPVFIWHDVVAELGDAPVPRHVERRLAVVIEVPLARTSNRCIGARIQYRVWWQLVLLAPCLGRFRIRCRRRVGRARLGVHRPRLRRLLCFLFCVQCCRCRRRVRRCCCCCRCHGRTRPAPVQPQRRSRCHWLCCARHRQLLLHDPRPQPLLAVHRC